MSKIHELQFELIDHPPYSPDLAPSHFFIFPKLKVWLEGQKFSSNEEVRCYRIRRRLFCRERANYYLEGLNRLDHRCKKCMVLKGDYVEK
jgi:histone-lysine N-methyltransferase SETMAR